MRRVCVHLRSEHGTTLVEVIAAAVLLVVISGAVTSLMINAQKASGNSRLIAIAGDLAQTELETLRADKFANLKPLATSSTSRGVAISGVTFRVSDSAAFNAQPVSGAAGCSATTSAAEALRLTVSVTWDGSARKPVTLDTLVAVPVGSGPSKGNFVAVVTDRDNVPVPGVAVNLSGGATPMSGTTDADGCVRFSDVTAGTYTLTGTKSGYVTPAQATQIFDQGVTVEAGTTNNATYLADQGGGVRVQFKQGTTATDAPVPGARLFADNITVNAVPPSGATAPNATWLQPAPLWPSASQYAVYADTCTSGQPVGTVAVGRGAFPTTATQLKLPLMNVSVSNLTKQAQSTVGVKAASACGTPYTLSGPAPGSSWTSSAITVPPGPLQKLCLYYQLRNNSNWYYKDLSGSVLASTDLAGKTFDFGDAQAFSANATDVSQVCP